MRIVTVPGTGERFDLHRPGAVAAWNRALNRRFAMCNLTGHRNALVRRIEARRRARIAARVPAFERALDLGAEDGSLAELWRDRGRMVLLLDLDPQMLCRAGRPAIVADAARIPLADRSTDLVVAGALLEHVLDPGAVVRECARVLRPGGRIVAYVPWDRLVVPLKRWARRIGIDLGPLAPGPAPGHLRAFDRRGLEALFRPVSVRVRVRRELLSLGWYVEATVP